MRIERAEAEANYPLGWTMGMIVWLLNKLFATGDGEDVSEDLPYEIGERVGGGVRGRARVKRGEKKVAAKVLEARHHRRG